MWLCRGLGKACADSGGLISRTVGWEAGGAWLALGLGVQAPDDFHRRSEPQHKDREDKNVPSPLFSISLFNAFG